MRLYIAGHSQEQARATKDLLEEHGYEIVARWIVKDTKFASGLNAYSDSERQNLAAMDEHDVRESDALVLLAEPEGKTVPGGKHVETGIALALSKRVYVVGRRENLFHWHPLVTVVA